jgi:hypothetical protein
VRQFILPKFLSDITNIELIAERTGIRNLSSLKHQLGGKNWRKKKGKVYIEDEVGQRRLVEVHWYEAHGVGRVKLKIKRYLD